MPLSNPFRRAADRPTLRERAADLKASLASAIRRPAPEQAEPAAPPLASFVDQIAQAGLTADVLAACGIDHRDGTVSYADALGRVVRRPMAHWIAFTAQQMHGRIRSEISRREVIEANHLPMAEHTTWDAEIRRELRSDAVFALAFRPERAFKAEQDFRDLGEPRQLDLIAAAGFALSSLSLRDIAALHDITVTLSNVLRAMRMQPRSWHGPHLNDVGKLTEWLGDQLDAQIDRTVNELRGRTPADWIERAIRLEAIAEATVSNGDPAQTAAFARELLASVEA